MDGWMHIIYFIVSFILWASEEGVWPVDIVWCLVVFFMCVFCDVRSDFYCIAFILASLVASVAWHTFVHLKEHQVALVPIFFFGE